MARCADGMPVAARTSRREVVRNRQCLEGSKSRNRLSEIPAWPVLFRLLAHVRKGKHMRVVSLLCGVVTLAAARGAAQDPVKVDPQHYKVEFENAQVRVLRIKYGPHEKSVMHWHPAGVAVLLTDLHVKFGLPGGKATEQLGTAGQVVSEAAGSHLPENLSDRPVELILVELKNPTAAKKGG